MTHQSTDERLSLERPNSRKSIEFEIDRPSGDLCITMSGGDLQFDAITYLDKDEGKRVLDLLTRWLS